MNTYVLLQTCAYYQKWFSVLEFLMTMYMQIFDIRNWTFDRKNMEFINVIRYNCTIRHCSQCVIYSRSKKDIWGLKWSWHLANIKKDHIPFELYINFRLLLNSFSHCCLWYHTIYILYLRMGIEADLYALGQYKHRPTLLLFAAKLQIEFHSFHRLSELQLTLGGNMIQTLSYTQCQPSLPI